MTPDWGDFGTSVCKAADWGKNGYPDELNEQRGGGRSLPMPVLVSAVTRRCQWNSRLSRKPRSLRHRRACRRLSGGKGRETGQKKILQVTTGGPVSYFRAGQAEMPKSLAHGKRGALMKKNWRSPCDFWTVRAMFMVPPVCSVYFPGFVLQYLLRHYSCPHELHLMVFLMLPVLRAGFSSTLASSEISKSCN